ncbi:hypothetical protein [Chryseobacterium terrae]|uniref:Plasmid stabilization system protein ParE n=1 Tax=Chryseobacterium terrae TaxID=3163299 RepID=A0ABW8Y134_9FLAO
MEEIVIYSEEFHQSIEELVETLYSKQYFGFKVDCQSYADKIYDFIDFNVMKPISKNSPFPYRKFGKKFIKYKANNNTAWYIFFDQNEHRFLINHIINNHSQEFPDLL